MQHDFFFNINIHLITNFVLWMLAIRMRIHFVRQIRLWLKQTTINNNKCTRISFKISCFENEDVILIRILRKKSITLHSSLWTAFHTYFKPGFLKMIHFLKSEIQQNALITWNSASILFFLQLAGNVLIQAKNILRFTIRCEFKRLF